VERNGDMVFPGVLSHRSRGVAQGRQIGNVQGTLSWMSTMACSWDEVSCILGGKVILATQIAVPRTYHTDEKGENRGV
jgi:hypothetical protein